MLAYYKDYVVDDKGNIVDGAEVTVYKAGTTNTVSLFTDSAGNNSLANPTQTTSKGAFAFYVEPGIYDIVANNGAAEVKYPNQALLDPLLATDGKVYVAGVSLDREDGGIQTLTLTAASTLSIALPEGQSLTLHISGGDTHTVTWPTMTWVGGSAPALTSTDVIEFWKVDSTLYGAYVGSI